MAAGERGAAWGGAALAAFMIHAFKASVWPACLNGGLRRGWLDVLSDTGRLLAGSMPYPRQHGAFAMPLVRLRRPRVWNGVCISRAR